MKTSLKIIKMVSVSCMILFGMFLTACGGGGGTTAPTYTVGGTVSGLSGTLVLQNNGGDDLTITSNGAFTFTTPLPNSASYDVTMLTSPSNQNCTCTNGSGIISGANVSDVEVTCVNKSWTHPADITDNISPDGQHASNPQVAMDSNGNAIVTWEQSDGSNKQIFMSEHRNGSWTYPADLADNISPDGQIASDPQVAMDSNGDAIITWAQSDGSNFQIFMSEYRSGSWTDPADLADNISPNGQNASNPEVAMDDNGNAVIAWSQRDGSNVLQIFMSEYRNGSWTDPADLADNISPNGQNADYPQVAMDNNGNAIITWEQSDGSNKQIFMSEYRNGSWTHPANVADNISPDGQDAYYAQVAMDNNGNAIITWLQSDGSNAQIFMSEYRNGSWTHPANVADNISPDGQSVSDSQVAMDDNGNAIITWAQSDGSNWQIFMSEYRNGSWTHPADLADNISPDGQDAYIVCGPQVAMDNNGNAIITWEQSDGSNWQIFMSEYRNGSWTHPADLADNISPDGQSAYYARVAMDNNGNAIITWLQSDGSNVQIFMSDYY